MVVAAQDGLVQPPPLLLLLLADGELHSGEWLAKQLGQSRAAVWKGIERLRAGGIAVDAIARRGYRLPHPVELLDAQRIVAHLDAEQRSKLRTLEVLFEIDSTNTRLMAAGAPPYGQADACMCELQHAGRGRLGRRWLAPFGAGLAMSLGWNFADASRDLPALSLAVGVAVARGLARAGADGIALKWPNDIWFRDRKLGGVLIELRAEAGGPAQVVVGVGLNVFLSEFARAEIEAGGVLVACAADACQQTPSRNLLAGAILSELLSMLTTFEQSGFAAFRGAWLALDALAGREAHVSVGGQVISGIAKGLDTDGALLLDNAGRLTRIVSGEASLRLNRG